MKKVSGWKMKDWKDSWQPMMKRLFGFWRRMMRSLQGKCLGEFSDSIREKERENQEAKRQITNEVASNPFETVAPAGRSTTRHIGEKAKERKGRKENRNSCMPRMKTKVICPMTVAKEKADMDMTKENPKRSQPRQRIWTSSPPISRLHHAQSLHTLVGQTKIGIHHGIGVNQAILLEWQE